MAAFQASSVWCTLCLSLLVRSSRILVQLVSISSRDLRAAHVQAHWLRAIQACMDPATAYLRTPIVPCAETVAILI